MGSTHFPIWDRFKITFAEKYIWSTVDIFYCDVQIQWVTLFSGIFLEEMISSINAGKSSGFKNPTVFKGIHLVLIGLSFSAAFSPGPPHCIPLTKSQVLGCKAVCSFFLSTVKAQLVIKCVGHQLSWFR